MPLTRELRARIARGDLGPEIELNDRELGAFRVTLERVPVDDRGKYVWPHWVRDLPDKGLYVYLLERKGETILVGRSGQVRGQCKQHIRCLPEIPDWATVIGPFKSRPEAIARERALIEIHHPRLNQADDGGLD